MSKADGTLKQQRARWEASASANALNRALQNLNAALSELDEAHAHAAATGSLSDCLRIDAERERHLYRELTRLLTEVDSNYGTDPKYGFVNRVRALRDRRAETARFSFGEEG